MTAGLRFFMPGITDDVLEESYQSLRQHITRTTALVISNRRICSIEYLGDRNVRKIARVGKKLPMRRADVVVAILDASLLYFICTPGHGFGGGKPIVVYAADVIKLRYFDE